MILKCTCIHPAQDRLHGIGNRVHNKLTRTTGGQLYRCTVCKKERAMVEYYPVEPAKSEGTK